MGHFYDAVRLMHFLINHFNNENIKNATLAIVAAELYRMSKRKKLCVPLSTLKSYYEKFQNSNHAFIAVKHHQRLQKR